MSPLSNSPNAVFTLAQLLAFLEEGEIVNLNELTPQQLTISITGIATLEQATRSQLSFFANPHYQNALHNTQAGAVLVDASSSSECPPHSIVLISKNPYLTFAKLTQLFAYTPITSATSFIHPTATVAKTAIVGEQVHIGAFCVIGEHVVVGDGCQLASHVTIEDFASLGKNCNLSSFAFVAHHCQLGDGVVLHSHASIGNDGFGYAPKGNPAIQGWQKIHQIGKVMIGDNVRVGSHTCIDRGALGDTIIEDNVIIDNLVQIAHNVHIGAGTAIAACVGIAGSSQVGKRCVLAGGVGLVGHIELCDDVTITGMTMVTKSITQPGSYSSGTPMMPTALWRKVAVKFKHLI